MREPVPGVDDKWRHLESPHFELYSRISDGDARDFLRNLELLRAVFIEALLVREVVPLEVRIFCFRDERSFEAYAAKVGMGGKLEAFYLSWPDRGVIVVGPAFDSLEARRVIFHEYIHHLTTVVGDVPALWYREGVAELFSTMEENGNDVVLGKPLPGHVVGLRTEGLMSLSNLFSIGKGDPYYNETYRVGQMYAQSWALMHYWYFGKSGLPHESIDRFLRYVRREGEAGDNYDRRELFQKCMGMDYDDMNQRLAAYIQNGRYFTGTMKAPKIADRKTYAVRGVSREEIRRELVELDLRVNRSPNSRLILLDLADKNRHDPRPDEVLGADALVDGDENAALRYWDDAMAAGSANSAVFHQLSILEYRRWYSNFDPYYFRPPPDRTERLRGLLERSIEAAPDQAQAYEMLAWVEETAEKPRVDLINRIQRQVPRLQQRDEVSLALALIHIRLKDYDGAATILAELREHAESKAVRAQLDVAQKFLEHEKARP